MASMSPVPEASLQIGVSFLRQLQSCSAANKKCKLIVIGFAFLLSVKHCHHTCSFMPLPHLAATLSFFYCGKSSKKNPPLQLFLASLRGVLCCGASLFLIAAPCVLLLAFNCTLSGIWIAKKQRLPQHS